MAIPNQVQPMRSGIAGTLATSGIKRVIPCTMDYDFVAADENHATPSRAVTFTDATNRLVETGGGGTFAGLLLGNMRVASSSGESWFADGDTVEVLQLGEMFVNIDTTADTDVAYQALKYGDKVYFEKATGKLTGAPNANQGDYVEIKGALITDVSPYVATEGARLARVTITGPNAS